MPIEIRELIIKTSVEGDAVKPVGTSPSSDGQKQSEIEAIAEKVLEIIRMKNER